ncbi:c-type cytochrome [Denitratisoma oestradiolicum]|uniref:Cytochrome c-551 n=1 Tax=Denitratisoma oestradiolicum TaxID=311182 RepID=A0A6S6XW59_9PROT|nr:c-type cytochrome [Denitratisoma oestradiolicum]TWO82210.1 hypothetical protein CBW56_01845 [Denitratisoma oestradiolicum]CAB1369152.1 Cytochrome c-551 [Denitratisoma oestradiolicum]
MKLLYATVIAATVLVATPALANKDLATKSGCLACHQADKKVVGPAYRDVAKKYAGDKAAEAMLFDRVKKGSAATGGNKWPGPPIPMPPNEGTVKDDDIKVLVKWILAGAH